MTDTVIATEVDHGRALIAAAAGHLSDLNEETATALNEAVAATGADESLRPLVRLLACSAAEAWLWLAKSVEADPFEMLKLVLTNMAEAGRPDPETD